MSSSPVACRWVVGGGPHCPGATAGAIAGGLPLFVDGGEHERDVRGQQVVHLVGQAGLAEQPTTPYQTADGHVEVVGTTTPVGDLCIWVYIQDFLEESKRTKNKIKIVNEQTKLEKIWTLCSSLLPYCNWPVNLNSCFAS